VTHGVVCLTTGLWRAEYCRACTRQQREDAVVWCPLAPSRARPASRSRVHIFALIPAPRSRPGVRPRGPDFTHRQERERLCKHSGLTFCRGWPGIAAVTRTQVCSRWHDDLYVEVVRRGAGRQGRFLSLRGACFLPQPALPLTVMQTHDWSHPQRGGAASTTSTCRPAARVHITLPS